MESIAAEETPQGQGHKDSGHYYLPHTNFCLFFFSFCLCMWHVGMRVHMCTCSHVYMHVGMLVHMYMGMCIHMCPCVGRSKVGNGSLSASLSTLFAGASFLSGT